MSKPQGSEVEFAPMTVAEAAQKWHMSESRVKILVDQKRVKHVKKGGGDIRAGTILIMQPDPPPPAAPGTLTEEQRAVKAKKVK